MQGPCNAYKHTQRRHSIQSKTSLSYMACRQPLQTGVCVGFQYRRPCLLYWINKFIKTYIPTYIHRYKYVDESRYIHTYKIILCWVIRTTRSQRQKDRECSIMYWGKMWKLNWKTWGCPLQSSCLWIVLSSSLHSGPSKLCSQIHTLQKPPRSHL